MTDRDREHWQGLESVRRATHAEDQTGELVWRTGEIVKRKFHVLLFSCHTVLKPNKNDKRHLFTTDNADDGLQALTDPRLLYQIVQLLLTYDPPIVQRVATLLYLVMQV